MLSSALSNDEEFQWDERLGKSVPSYHPMSDVEYALSILKDMDSDTLLATVIDFIPVDAFTRLSKALAG